MNRIIIVLFVMQFIMLINPAYKLFVNSKSLDFSANSVEHPHHLRHKGSPNMWTMLGQPPKSEHLERHRDRHTAIHHVNNHEENLTLDEHKKVITNCPKCHNKQEAVQMTEEQLTELRIEYVKNQILKKLKLKEPPKVSLSDLPRPVIEGATMERAEDESTGGIPDEYYAQTTQKIFFPQLLGRLNIFLNK